MSNQIMIIAPYWVEELGAWVFDDPRVGLRKSHSSAESRR